MSAARAREVVRSLKPGESLNGMPVTSELREMYSGREQLLFARAKYSDSCRAAFDAIGLCQLRKLSAYECQEAWKAFAPCATQLHQKKIVGERMARLEAQKKRKAAREAAAGR